MSDNKFNIKAWIKRNAVGLIAIVISIIAISVALVYKQPITADWLGVLVGILSLLIMMLIGWNIYSVIDLNKIRHDTEKINKELETRVNNIESKVKADMTYEMLTISNFYQSITVRSKVDALACGFRNFKILSDENIAKSLWREWILSSFINFVDKEDSAQDSISYLKQNIPLEERNTFVSEFLTYTEEEKKTKYKGVQELLLLLVNNCLCNDDSNKSK